MIPISAQVSLYPLRRNRISPFLEQAYMFFRAHELAIRSGDMRTGVTGNDEAVSVTLKEILATTAQQGIDEPTWFLSGHGVFRAVIPPL